MTPPILINRNYQQKLLYVGVLLCMYKSGISAGAKCGRPGRTVNSTYRPPGNAFSESDVIRYACSEKDYVILGSSERTCQKNGSWSNEIPVCSKLVKFEDSEVGILNTIDGNTSTCSEAPNSNQTIWRGYLFSSINISAVRISVLGKRVDFDITIQEVESQIGKRCKIKTESSEIIMKSTTTLTFYCPDSTVGKFVHITCNNQALRICEVSVLLPPVPSCLTPDIPLHGNGLMRTSGKESTYTFKCHEGYKLWGNLQVTCQANGKWFPRSPVCEEIYCYALENFENGEVKYSPNNSRISYNGTAKFTCKNGFYIEGHPTIACYRWNEWNFPAPVCKPTVPAISRNISVKETWKHSNVTHCENLPHIANGALIVNSTNIGSIAWLKCSEGFKPFMDTNVLCLATGKWSSPSIYCSRSSAVRWGSNWTPSLMLLAAVGAGAGTAILIICIFVVFLVIRKRQQSQTNTTVFHLDNISDKDRTGQSNNHGPKCLSIVENYNAVKSRSQSLSTNSRKSHSALPNLPVDADPFYAQPFETDTAKKTSIVINKNEDLYNTHIYAEPIDSRNQTATHQPISKIMSQMKTDTKISAIKTNSVYESLSLVKTEQQNCDKKCAIYDSSSNSTLNK